MNANFNNPVIDIKFNGKSFQQYFGGPKPYGWIDTVKVVSKLGKYSEIEVGCTLPYKDALDLISEFRQGGKSIVPGADRMAIKLGYYPNFWSPTYIAFVSDFPDVTFAQNSTIVFKCVGCDYYMFNDNTAMQFKDETIINILKKVCDNAKVTVDTGSNDKGYDFGELKNLIKGLDAGKKFYEDSANMKMFISSVSRSKMNSTISYDAKNSNSWSYVRKFLDSLGLVFCIYGKNIVVFDINESAIDTAGTKFELFGKFEFSDYSRVIPFTDISFDFLPTTYMGSGTNLRDVVTDEKKAGPGTPVTPAKSEVTGGTNVPLGTESALSGLLSSVKTFMSGSSDNNFSKLVSQGETNNNQMISVKCSLDTVGLPDVIPGETCKIDLGRPGLSWVWRVLSVTHNWDGGFKSNFEFIITDNPFKTPNTTEPKTDNKLDVQAALVTQHGNRKF